LRPSCPQRDTADEIKEQVAAPAVSKKIQDGPDLLAALGAGRARARSMRLTQAGQIGVRSALVVIREHTIS
jgi:hypothetical protein